MIMPARSGQPETPLKPREVTAALRRIYPPSVPVRSSATLDGSVLVSLGNPAGRYLGVGRDDRAAANLLGWYLRQPVTISGHEYAAGSCAFTVAPDPGGRWPVHPGGSEAVPAYTTTSEVLGDFPANRIAMGLISLALEAGCRPHLSPWRSGHGRQYRVSLWHTDPELLFGCIDVGEEGGRFAAAYLQWGRGPELGTPMRRSFARTSPRAGTCTARKPPTGAFGLPVTSPASIPPGRTAGSTPGEGTVSMPRRPGDSELRDVPAAGQAVRPRSREVRS